MRHARSRPAPRAPQTSLAPGRREVHAVDSSAVVVPMPTSPTAVLVGAMALVFSGLYFLSDVIETMQGGFSTGQLWLTLVAEAAVPVFVIGLAVVQRPYLGRVGTMSAVAYAYAYVVFTGTVVYALVNHTPDYQALSDDLGAVMISHGAVMVVAGLGFGYAVRRARLLPAWTALALGAGVILVALTQTMPESVQLGVAAVRDAGFAGMGAALLLQGHKQRNHPDKPS